MNTRESGVGGGQIMKDFLDQTKEFKLNTSRRNNFIFIEQMFTMHPLCKKKKNYLT